MASLIVSPVRGIEAARSFAERSPTCFTALLQNIPVVRLASSRLTFNTLQHRLCRHSRGQSQANVWEKGDIQAVSETSSQALSEHYIHALLLVYFASQNRPLVATSGFVEVILEMFLEGISLSEMEAMMAVARLESGGQLVGPLEQEVMLSWSAMVSLTLQAIGLPLRPSGEARRARSESSSSTGQMERGMASFVRQTIGMYRSGFDSRRMLLQQSLADFTQEPGSMSAGTKYMQQNTRLVVLTLEAVRESGMVVEAQLGPSVLTSAAGEDSMSSGSMDVTSSGGDSSDEGPPLPPPAQFQPTQWHTSAAAPEPHDSTEGGRASSSQGASASGRQPIDYIFGFLPGARQQELASARDTPVQQLELRSAALYLLMAFIGAQAKSLYAVQAFVRHARRCYGRGWAVQELYERLTGEEKYQGVGGALQVRAPNPGEQQRLSGHIFAQWLSIVYMTFAQARPSSYLYLSLSREPALATKRTSAVLSGQMGSPPGQGKGMKDGWAWVDTQPGQDAQILEAYRLADLVSNTLRLQAERDAVENGRPWPGSSAAEAALREHFSGEEGTKALDQQVKESGSIVVIEDPSLKSTSPMLIMISQFTGLVKLSRDLVLSEGP